ncbi:MAG: hypothetical protein KAI47_15860 [Deltaproteobacteria bacterium]|nr:hypothetical protein [Deltaproteobacteria bacterium]
MAGLTYLLSGCFLLAINISTTTGCAGTTSFPVAPDSAPSAEPLTFEDSRFVIGDAGDGSTPVDIDLTKDGQSAETPLLQDGQPTSCTPGLCRGCKNGNAFMPTDDPNCGVIDCDGLDTYAVKGAASATGTNYRIKHDYSDLTQARCKALGQCKKPNSLDCTQVKDVTVNTCGICSRATKTGCANYADYISCAGTYAGCDSRCFSGACAWRLFLHDNGSENCAVVCSWDGKTCRGGRTDSGKTVDCSYKGEDLWCYCAGTPHC